MKKSIAIIVVLFVSIFAFAGNTKPVPVSKKVPPVKIEQKRKDMKPILKPVKGKKVAKM